MTGPNPPTGFWLPRPVKKKGSIYTLGYLVAILNIPPMRHSLSKHNAISKLGDPPSFDKTSVSRVQLHISLDINQAARRKGEGEGEREEGGTHLTTTTTHPGSLYNKPANILVKRYWVYFNLHRIRGRRKIYRPF